MANIIAVLIIILIVVCALIHIIKNKKSGKMCCGCPSSGMCQGNCSGSCSSCKK